MKNALDSLEGAAGRPRGPTSTAARWAASSSADGWQACGSALAALRAIVHALRGWPTPLGATFNPAAPAFDDAGAFCEEANARQVEMLAGQVVSLRSRDEAVAVGP